MPNWNEVLSEIQTFQENANRESQLVFSKIRQKYLQELFKKRKRNIITYYSGWLQRPPNAINSSIHDNDKNSFMNVTHGLDREKGLDLILHTPGGDLAATESLVDYLKEMFNSDIEVFVPQLAMSAGTMIACAAKKIHMGKHSSLGPIDPQIEGVPAIGILEEFEKATQEIKQRPEKLLTWQMIIGKLHPSLILSCENAIAWSKSMVEEWLSNMYPEDTDKQKRREIAEKLSDHQEMKTHSRHISLKEAENIGLKISALEEDDALQDLVLTIHHTYMHTLNSLPIIKIVENHQNVGQVLNIDIPK